MALDPVKLSELVRRGETLEERLARFRSGAGREIPELDSERRDPRIEAALLPWARAAAGGDSSLLAKRLAWDGVSSVDAARAFGLGEDGEPAPARWHRTLRCALEASVRSAESAPSPHLDTGKGTGAPTSIAFAPLWRPWVEVAEERLGEESEHWHLRLTASARRELLDELYLELCQLGSLAAYQRFDAARSSARAAAAEQRANDRADDGSGGHLYHTFVRAGLGQPLETLYGPFPVLARQIAELVDRWIDAVLEMLERLDRDWREVRVFAGVATPAARIAAIGSGSSDAHHGGRRVRRLRFDDPTARELIYKPRDVGAEAAVERLFAWARAAGLGIAPRAPGVLVREGYGWAEAIDQETLTCEREAEVFFRRAGALLAFAGALRARDLHAENVVATTAGPVVVDCEMFFQPAARTWSSHGEARDTAGSCLDTGLLLQPAEAALEHGQERNLGGLRPCRSRPGLGVGQRFEAVNTDLMALETGSIPGELGRNTPYLGGKPLDPSDFGSALREGFSEAYRFLLDRRAELLEDGGPLAPVRGVKVRVLLRPSQVYGRALTLARVPRNQRSGLATSLIAETLLAPLLAGEEKPRVWPLAADERHALHAGDIPHFNLPGDDVAVLAGDGSRVPIFSSSPADSVRARLLALGDEDHARQLADIELALTEPVRYEFLDRGSPGSEGDPPGPVAEDLAIRCRRWALGLAGLLLEGGRWRDRERSADSSFGRGQLGIGLFFLGCARAGEPAAAEAARELLAPLLETQ
ncbi:MAG: type 2 lanthipeptide synthetase LanM, partial [Holophagales bacterium]|nr:type 2 lanthipeptide synthetase LanM [Holophagales bacterium]